MTSADARTPVVEALRFAELMEQAELAVVVLDARGVVAWGNPHLARLLGRPREEVVGADWIGGFVAPEAREGVRCLFRDVSQGKAESFQHELDVLRADGTRRNVRFTTTILRDGGGFAGVACVGEDVTMRRRAAEAHRLARAALQSSGTAVAIADAQGRLVEVNPAFHRLWGYPRDATLLGRSVTEFWTDPAAAREVADAVAREGEWRGELVARRADGREAIHRVHANLFSDPETGTVRLIATFEDVTELRRTEERLLRAQRLAQVGYWSIDLATGGLTWSDETYRIFGVARESFAGTQDAFLALLHAADRARVEAAFGPIVETGDPASIDFRVLLAGGGERVVHSEARLARDATGRPVELRGMVQDVTARVRLEEQLRQAQKMEAVGALAGGIAHDFNNLLTVILSVGGMALESAAPDDPVRGDLHEIVSTAKRAEALTRQILAFARRQFTRPVDLDLNGTISGAAKMIERLIGEHIEVRLRLAPELPHVVADPRQLEQVLVNLAVNARDAMPSGGVVEISTRRLAPEPAGRGGSERVELAVRDTGVGMDEETRARAFDPFFTTKGTGHGTGLGLAVVHGIVEQCGGTVRLDSAPGEGTTAVIELPAGAAQADASTPAAAPSRPARAGSPAGGTVLLVEDEPAVRAIAVRVLERAGYRVLSATGGDAALHLAAGEPRIDLVLSDVVMPGMGGAALVERLRLERPGIRVLFMSGYSADLPKALAPTGGSLLQKPFTPAALLARVAEAIAGDSG